MDNSHPVVVSCNECEEIFPGMRISKYRFEVKKFQSTSFYLIVGHDFEIKCKIPKWDKDMDLELQCDRDLFMMVNAEYYTTRTTKELSYYLKNNNQLTRYTCNSPVNITLKPLTKDLPLRYVIVGQVYHHEKRSNKMTEDYSNLLLSDDLKDITFVIADREIKAHKLILSARNSKFAQFFQLIENPVKITISNIEPDIFEMLLRFIYAEKIPDLDIGVQSWIKLLVAAEEFMIEELKDICQCNIAKFLDIDNCIDIYILSDVTKTESLKDKSMRFIKAHSGDVIRTKKYIDMIESQPHMVAALLNKLLSNDIF